MITSWTGANEIARSIFPLILPMKPHNRKTRQFVTTMEIKRNSSESLTRAAYGIPPNKCALEEDYLGTCA